MASGASGSRAEQPAPQKRQRSPPCEEASACSAERPAKKSRGVVLVSHADVRVRKQSVAYIDCETDVDAAIVAAIEAAETGCSAMCISLDPTLSCGWLEDYDKTEHPINGKTYIMQAVSHLAIMYDPLGVGCIRSHRLRG